MNSLESAQRLLGLKGYQMAQELRITPEWYSKLVRGRADITQDLQLRLDDLLRRKKIEPTSISRGDMRQGRPIVLKDGPPPMVASRLPSTPGAPSTRADCEHLFEQLLDAAERTGNPNAFPAIYDWMTHNFPAHLRGETKPD